MHILFITDYVPYPPVSGTRVRVYNLMRRVAQHHRVSLAALTTPDDDGEGVVHLRTFCEQVVTAPIRRRSFLAHLPGLLRFALAGWPLELKFLYSHELVDKIKELGATVPIDVLQIEDARMALYNEALPSTSMTTRILAFHNVTSTQFARIAGIERTPMQKVRGWLHSRMMDRWEPRYAQRFDRCITVSEEDRRLLLERNAALRIDVLPNGVDTQRYHPLARDAAQPAVLFIGNMDYTPCIDAAIYFVNDIWPRLRQARPDLELWLVGAAPAPEVLALRSDAIHVTGRVESVEPYYARSAVAVVPLRAGGGTRLKILEAMALGRPVVSTTLGAEGLDVINGRHLLLADTPAEFTAKTINLLTDNALYGQIVANARQLVVDKYDWDSIAHHLLKIYSELDGQYCS